MVLMTLGNGVLASYQQCHFTPDYWRNYTVIGTEGRWRTSATRPRGGARLEPPPGLVGDRRPGAPDHGRPSGHADADLATMAEFLAHVADGAPTLVSPLAAREAVATGALATASLRSGSVRWTSRNPPTTSWRGSRAPR